MFTSPLHRTIFMLHHYSGTCTTSQEWSVLELIKGAVERMDPGILQKTESLDSKGWRLERCWQMELYRVTLGLLPRGRVVSSDVARVCAFSGPNCSLSCWLPMFLLVRADIVQAQMPSYSKLVNV